MRVTRLLLLIILGLSSPYAIGVEEGADGAGQSLQNYSLDGLNLGPAQQDYRENDDGGAGFLNFYYTGVQLTPEQVADIINNTSQPTEGALVGESLPYGGSQWDAGTPSDRIPYFTPSIERYELGLIGSVERFTGVQLSKRDALLKSGNNGFAQAPGPANNPWTYSADVSWTGHALDIAGGQGALDYAGFLIDSPERTGISRPYDYRLDYRWITNWSDFSKLSASARYEFSTFTGAEDRAIGFNYNSFSGSVDLDLRLGWEMSCNNFDPQIWNEFWNGYQTKAMDLFPGSEPFQYSNSINDNTIGLDVGLEYRIDLPNLKGQYKNLEQRINAAYASMLFQMNEWGCDPSLLRFNAASAGAEYKPVADPEPVAKRFPNDGFFHTKGSWGQDFDDQWGLKRIGIESINRKKTGSPWDEAGHFVTVAVVDSGIDYGHPELVGQLWVNVKEDPLNQADDDGNEYTDDFIGWNFVGNNPLTRDDNGHGTFVAGIIAARIDNGIGMTGINPWARILPVKVSDALGRSSSSDVAAGIAYASRMGARVINVSIAGDTLTDIEQAAIDEAAKAGALVVVAAGNDAKDTVNISPAGLKGVITVAATGPDDERAGYSNWGGEVDISAPGSDILSLRAIQTDLLQFVDDNYQPGSNIMGSNRHYYRLSGTSFAAPYVSGIASLLFSLNPELTAEQVKRMILQSAKDIDVPGVDQNTGYGLLDAKGALTADPAFFVESALDGVQVAQADGKQVVRITGTADADQFKRAWVEIGAGDDPKKWKTVGGKIKKTVRNGTLADIEAGEFRGSAKWVLKVVTEHKNGRQREARFVLNLG